MAKTKRVHISVIINTVEREETKKIRARIQRNPNVVGSLRINAEGLLQDTTMDTAMSIIYASNIGPMMECAKNVVRDVEPANDLKFVRLQSKKQEIMVANDSEFNIMLIMNR